MLRLRPPSAGPFSTRTFRTSTAAKRKQDRLWAPSRTIQPGQPSFWDPSQLLRKTPSPSIFGGDTQDLVRRYVEPWSRLSEMRRRLERFGIPYHDIRPLLNEFVKSARSGNISHKEARDKYNLDRLSDVGFRHESVDRIFTSIFFTWASDPTVQRSLASIVPASTIFHIQRLHHAADLTYPADRYAKARQMRRKVIMHVGPTNSGKTHNALRALASANAGVYAGPLRLLAHEIWERLNKGTIVPLRPPPQSSASPNPFRSQSSLHNTPAITSDGNSMYARPCNLLTGEEVKIVAEDAPLLSATVEMVPVIQEYDVAVVDEIQMIADSERGGAWTNAVLGLPAKELHLCGEETAIPIIEALLKDTGDELTINRYKRLTPLVVQEESLEGDLSRVRKGDCIVTFSRASIFGLKRRVEDLTGLRCAVAYGRLPPEVRSEQAALFNDPNSGYDVMIGSDAIGMGLNLKIKRVIFAAVWKWDGHRDRPLSVSQLKQIAGRAGRYGLQKDDEESPQGYATTLLPRDLPILREALAAPARPLKCAFITGKSDLFVSVSQALPPGSTTQTIYEAHVYISKVRSPYRCEEYPRLSQRCQFLDDIAGALTLEDRDLLMRAPVPWRDLPSMEVVARFFQMYRKEMKVKLLQALKDTDLINAFHSAERSMERGTPANSGGRSLELLESLDKILVLYLWLGIRNPVAFCDMEQASEIKRRLQKTLHWSLKHVSWDRRSRTSPWIGWDSSQSQNDRPDRVNLAALVTSRGSSTPVAAAS